MNAYLNGMETVVFIEPQNALPELIIIHVILILSVFVIIDMFYRAKNVN